MTHSGSQFIFQYGNTVITIEGRAVAVREAVKVPAVWDAIKIRSRLMRWPEERDRVGISTEQFNRFTSLIPRVGKIGIDNQHILSLFAPLRDANNADAEKLASKALLDEVRAIDERTARQQADYEAQIHTIFTDRQWMMLHFAATTVPVASPPH